MTTIQNKAPSLADMLVKVSAQSLTKPYIGSSSLLSKVMVQDLAKLSPNPAKPHFLKLSKAAVNIAGMLTNVDMQKSFVTSTRGGVSGTVRARDEDLSVISTCEDDLSGVTTQAGKYFLTSLRGNGALFHGARTEPPKCSFALCQQQHSALRGQDDN